MPDSPAAVGSWDVLVSPWHLEERIEGFPVPAGAVVLPASVDQTQSELGRSCAWESARIADPSTLRAIGRLAAVIGADVQWPPTIAAAPAPTSPSTG